MFKSAFSRHDNVRASPTLFIWLNENVRIIAPITFSLIAHAGALPLFLSPKLGSSVKCVDAYHAMHIVLM